MFRETVLQRPGPSDEEDRFTRDRMPGEQPAYHRPLSPAQTPYGYSPTNRSSHPSNPPTPAPLPHHHSTFTHPRPQPTSPIKTELPPITTAIYPREPTTSKYYDPTTDHGDRSVGRGAARYDGHYGSQPARDSYNSIDSRPADNSYDKPYQSPVATTFSSHRSPLLHTQAHSHGSVGMDTMSHSPISPKLYQGVPRGAVQPPPPAYSRRQSQHQDAPPPPTANPMSLSSIISSGADSEPPAPSKPQPTSSTKAHTPSTSVVKQESAVIKEEPAPPTAPAPITPRDGNATARILNSVPPATNGQAQSFTPREIPVPDEAAVEAELARIETMEMSDPEGPGFEPEKAEYQHRSKKRTAQVEKSEMDKRKKRRMAYLSRFVDILTSHREVQKQAFNAQQESKAWQIVQSQEIAEEKERKKDMQRKRRREKTIQNEQAKRDEALAKAGQAENEEEKEKHLRDAQKAEKKAKTTSQLLQGNAPSKDIRELTPHPNLEGGTMGSFQMSDDVPAAGKRKGGRQGGRLKKSKEQKQAEKDAAAAGQAALDRGDELPPIAPREEARLEALKSRSQTQDPVAPAGPPPYSSPAYDNLYSAIWRDIAKKDIPKVVRLKETSLATKQSNARKTAQLAAKEARRWQLRTNKSMKDIQARAKRSMREMLGFWKRNERQEKDMKKQAERQQLDEARKAEAEREANRQKRKLEFLISQTELYSHFIGKKVRTDELERSTNDAATANDPAGPSVTLPDGPIAGKVTNFDELDFDADDDTALRAAAMANAQNAVEEAQARARAFNDNDSDDGEMNFQNPTSLGSMEIVQPKLLNCQLKEYQLKGLNWLVNLYEQGINGILADEMGLGKTVQSISVMAYLAEHHNIWGPFLVIAPASTLHNWQQEIAKFVPKFKVLPYWGNAKDRKILRKFWEKKQITYTEDAPFHVLVTSYQLVVQDTDFFKKMKWQYMILDEAQAIKSSQSSRWKNLLSFNCRNRLLLTGTPIQNNMQELWALLHFIMPGLFDSHDEFSEWFSRDIESHAQSNTKLNEGQLRRLHLILKPFMLRRVKKHVQKELGDKIEKEVDCELSYRQRAYYSGLRNKISVMDLIEKAVGDEQDSATLMNLVMQFRKVCNHPDLFERAETWSPLSLAYFAETASFLREGQNVNVGYSTRNLIEYRLPRLICRNGGRLDIAGPENPSKGTETQILNHMMSIWDPAHMEISANQDGAFSFLRFVDLSAGSASKIARNGIFQRAVDEGDKTNYLSRQAVVYNDDNGEHSPLAFMLNIAQRNDRRALAEVTSEGVLGHLLNVNRSAFEESGLNVIEPCARPAASAPPIELHCCSQGVVFEKQRDFFNIPIRNALYGVPETLDASIFETKPRLSPASVPGKLPPPTKLKAGYNQIHVPSMRRFVTDSGKLKELDALLKELKRDGHRVLLYFQMTKMIDLMEEYLTYRNYRYCRLDGSTKLEDRRDTVADFQSNPDIFVFLLSTRAGGLGINLTSADTVIFYDSDWNPTIDSQAMDRAHRLGQTRQVTVYRLITRGTIEERIRKRAQQKEEVQRVVISGGAGAHVDFNTRSRENRTKDIAMWLADDEQAAEIEKREAEIAAAEASAPAGRKKKRKRADVSLDDMYHEGEGRFDDDSAKPSGTQTPVSAIETGPAKGAKRPRMSKKAKTLQQRLAVADGRT